MVQGEGRGGRSRRGDEVQQAREGRLPAAAEHARRCPTVRCRMVEVSTLFQHADVQIALVSELDRVPAGHGHRRSAARALQGGIGRFVRALEPCPAKRQCSRLEVRLRFGERLNSGRPIRVASLFRSRASVELSVIQPLKVFDRGLLQALEDFAVSLRCSRRAGRVSALVPAGPSSGCQEGRLCCAGQPAGAAAAGEAVHGCCQD